MLKETLSPFIPDSFRETFYLRTFGLLKAPALLFMSPSVIELTDQKCVVKVPLNYRTRNHLKSMYFGVLCAGADCAAGLSAMKQIDAGGGTILLSFKDFHAEFLKRAEGATLFTCTQGLEIMELVQLANETGERQNLPVHVTATVPSVSGDEPVARFVLTLSLKKRSKK